MSENDLFENLDQQTVEKNKIIERKLELIELLKEANLFEHKLAFPGINPEVLTILMDSYEPGYTTNIVELKAKYDSEGMKLVLHENTNISSVSVLPFKSGIPIMDELRLEHLEINDSMPEILRELIFLSRIKNLK
jgi:hypothetical protein